MGLDGLGGVGSEVTGTEGGLRVCCEEEQDHKKAIVSASR